MQELNIEIVYKKIKLQNEVGIANTMKNEQNRKTALSQSMLADWEGRGSNNEKILLTEAKNSGKYFRMEKSSYFMFTVLLRQVISHVQKYG